MVFARNLNEPLDARPRHLELVAEPKRKRIPGRHELVAHRAHEPLDDAGVADLLQSSAWHLKSLAKTHLAPDADIRHPLNGDEEFETGLANLLDGVLEYSSVEQMRVDHRVRREIEHDRAVVAEGDRVPEALSDGGDQAHRPTGRNHHPRTGGCRAFERGGIAG